MQPSEPAEDQLADSDSAIVDLASAARSTNNRLHGGAGPPVALLEAPPAPAPADEERSEPKPDAGPVRRRRIEATAAKVALAGTAVLIGFLVFLYLLSGLVQARAQSGLERRFARPLGFGTALIGGTIPYGTPIARLDIPTIGLHQVVVEGTRADNLRYGPGHLAASPLPGQAGNAVIAGHRMAWGGPFRQIGTLPTGAHIEITTGQGRFTYVVDKHYSAPASDVKPLTSSSGNRLTLFTAADWLASRRLIVVASLVGRPASSPAAEKPTVVTAADSGLSGQRGVGLVVLFWLELAILVSVASVFVYRYSGRWSAYLITTPIVVALWWIAYENLARLVPGTL